MFNWTRRMQYRKTTLIENCFEKGQNICAQKRKLVKDIFLRINFPGNVPKHRWNAALTIRLKHFRQKDENFPVPLILKIKILGTTIFLKLFRATKRLQFGQTCRKFATQLLEFFRSKSRTGKTRILPKHTFSLNCSPGHAQIFCNHRTKQFLPIVRKFLSH